PWQKKIVTLRVGGATGTHGPAAKRRQPDAKHPGKTAKKALAEIHFRPRLFSVFIMPVVLFFVSSTFMRKKFRLIQLYIAKWVQGQWPCRRGTGGEKPPASSSNYCTTQRLRPASFA
ncbi:MAG: hypothetical protein IJN44_09080, partial [Clostridia bacterium]|nr:hypothetical protein [Clostridia bacterium]